VVEGSKAAVRTRIKVTSTVTGQTAETETADFIEVKDGRIISFVQYCDTALAAKLATK
jgi:ketosteroid isomerase-like protein